MQTLSSVPKFGSFRPKQPSPEQEAAPPPVQHSPSSRDERHLPRDPRHRQRPRHRERTEEAHATSREPSRAPLSPNPLPDSPWAAQDDLFLIDRRGDTGISKYGTNSKSTVPSYRQPSERKLLGDGQPSSSRQPHLRSLLSTLTREERAKLKNEPLPLLSVSAQSASVRDVDFDYVPLLKGRKRRRVGSVGFASANNASASPEMSSDSDSRCDSDAAEGQSLGPVDSQSAIKEENARLSDRLKTEPQNAKAWEDYIAHQELWLEAMQGTLGQARTTADRRAIAEIRVALYSDALSKLRNGDPMRETFQLRMLQESASVWERRVLATKWEHTASLFPHSLDIQWRYLEFVQSTSDAANDRCRDLYFQYMNLLGRTESMDHMQLTSLRLSTLLRFTAFAHNSGFIELARSVWQGLLGMHILNHQQQSHPSSELSLELSLQRMEDFWDSEQPRVGERNTLADANDSHPVAPPSRDLSQASDTRKWFCAEKKASVEAARATSRTANQDEDPYRVILFDDIKPFLFTIPSAGSLHLVNAFLCFLHLPLLPCKPEGRMSSWCIDPYLLNSGGTVNNGLGRPTTFLSEPQTLFGHSSSFDHITDVEFVRNALYSLVLALPHVHELAEFYFSFLALKFPAQAREQAKSLLKVLPLDLRTYNAFALVEQYLGNSKASERVLTSALKMSSSLAADKQIDEIFLRQTWIWLALTEHKHVDGLDRLRNISDGGPAYEIIVRRRDEAIARKAFSNAVTHSEQIALESYLVMDLNLQSGLSSFRDEAALHGSIVEDSDFAVELLHQAQARLIEFHVSFSKDFSPANVKDVLRSSVLAFPNNTYFLRLFAENEARFSLDNRVRSSFAATISAHHDSGVVPWMFDISNEISRISSFGATKHSVRASFERAVASTSGQHSEMIWAAYLRYEIDVTLDMDRAKAVLYRGLGQLPWNKWYAMLAFELLGSVLTEGELRSVYSNMQDRGMRLHVGMDE